MIPNMDALGSLVKDMHSMLEGLFYLALPAAMALSVVIGYFQNGAPDYNDILRRSLVAAVLLVSFPEVSNLILDLCDGLAARIDNMSGLDTIMQMAQEKAQSYAGAKNALLLKFDDLIIAFLNLISFIFLYVARYLSIALYYFYWILLSSISPILIVLYVFPQTAGITKNLYKSLIEVASWKVIWAVQSAMLTALNYANIYQTQGSYITLIVLNLIIAIGMLFTPLIVKSLAADGAHSTTQAIGAMATAIITAAPSRLLSAGQLARTTLQTGRTFTNKSIQRIKQSIHKPRRSTYD